MLFETIFSTGRPANLSDGKNWRFRLAVALARKKRFIFADGFLQKKNLPNHVQFQMILEQQEYGFLNI